MAIDWLSAEQQAGFPLLGAGYGVDPYGMEFGTGGPSSYTPETGVGTENFALGPTAQNPYPYSYYGSEGTYGYGYTPPSSYPTIDPTITQNLYNPNIIGSGTVGPDQSTGGIGLGTPQQTWQQQYYASQAAEQARHDAAMEAIDKQKVAIQQQLANAQIAAAKGDPAAAQQVQQLQAQSDYLDQQKLALAQQQLAASTQLSQQQLAQSQAQFEAQMAAEAQKLGLTQQQFEAQMGLSRDQFNATVDQFNKTYGLDWMKNSEAVQQFNAQLGYNYWNSGNDLAFNTWNAQQQAATTQRGQSLQYNLGMAQNATNQQGQELQYNLGLGNLGLTAQNQAFNQAVQLSDLAANPRNLTQSLIMLGMSPDQANSFVRNTPYASAMMNNPTSLDKQPYTSAVPFQYGPNDLPLAYLPQGNGMQGYGFNNLNGLLPPAYVPPPMYNQAPAPPYVTVPPMTPTPPPSAPVAPPTTTTPTAPEAQAPNPPEVQSIPSFADWAAKSGYNYQGGYPARTPTGQSVIPNHSLDPYYGSSAGVRYRR